MKFKIGDRVLFNVDTRTYINSKYPGGIIVTPRKECYPDCYEVQFIAKNGIIRRMYNFREDQLIKDYGYDTPLKKALEED